MSNFIPCNKGDCNNGYIKTYDDGIDSITPCICRLTHHHELELESKYIVANIPKKSWSYSISDYVGLDAQGNIPKLKKFVNEFDEKFKNKHLYLKGLYGTQKSSLARWLVKELLRRGKTAHYNLLDDIIKQLVKLRDEDKDIDELEVLNCDFLVIDEADAEKCTIYQSGYQLSFLTTFLKKRLELVGKSTIFISNSDIGCEAFFNKFGGTIQDLIRRELDDTLIFEDNYEALSKDFNLESLWD